MNKKCNKYSKEIKILRTDYTHRCFSYLTLRMGKFFNMPNPSFVSTIISGSYAYFKLLKYNSSK